MKAKTKFTKIYQRLPHEARKGLVWDSYGKNPMTIDVIYWEVKMNTKLSKKLLNDMGFEK